jgi:sortase A
MARRPEDLSAKELEQLLLVRRRQERQQRLRRYHQIGRAIQAEVSGDAQAPLAAQQRRRWFDRLLLLVEVAAVLGLLIVGYGMFSRWQVINQEADALLAQSQAHTPTVEPTPLVQAVVLPSGHTPPTDPNGAQPNLAEIPAQLRPKIESQLALALPTPTAAPQHAVRIVIPEIQVDAPIVQGDGWEQLRQGVGQHLGSANPGQTGNLVLSAHNDIFGEIFRNLDQLKPGDTFSVYTADEQLFTYVVTKTKIVAPTAVEVLAPTDYPAGTLISCYPYLIDNKRIVVFSELQQ